MKTITLTIVLLIFSFNLIVAQPASKEFTTSSLKAMGAPNNPKVEIAWNRYYDWQEIGQICRRLAAAYPDLIRHSSIGKSVQGKDLHLLTVTNFGNGKPGSKPAMYIDGNIHSNEIQGAEVSLYTAWFLVENFRHIAWIKELLDQKVFYIVPTINPDARDYYIHEGNTPHSPRSGLLPRDDDGDGLLDEDGLDDLDNDGNIVMMRRRDPHGRWKADQEDSRLMVQAKPDEKGEYSLLGWEGFDNDDDGKVNEDGPGFYDPNRNWAWNWQPAYVQWGADQYPFSVPETRAVAEFVLSHENIAGAQTYHNYGGMILRGPGVKADESIYDKQDLKGYDFLGKLGEEILPGYRYFVIYKDLYQTYGNELDWFYGARGIFGFSNELWTSFDYFRRHDNQELSRLDQQKDRNRFDRLLLFGEGIVPWKKITHPQYGDIEIGGIKKSWSRAAPSFLIEEMCHRNMAFTLFHAYHLPLLSIDSIKVSELSGGVKQVDVLVKNGRVLPTRSMHEIKNRITPPDYIHLRGQKIEVISGFVVDNFLLDIAREQKYRPDRLSIDKIDGMNAVRVRWLITGKPPFTIVVNSKKGGRLTATVTD